MKAVFIFEKHIQETRGEGGVFVLKTAKKIQFNGFMEKLSPRILSSLMCPLVSHAVFGYATNL